MSGELCVDGVHVRIGGSHILQGVDLEASWNENGVTALLGRNGAGKTTTLKACLGLVPREGRVTLDGRDLTSLPTHEIVRLGVGYVPEDRGVFGNLTVHENIALADRNATRQRYDRVYDLFPELADRAQQLGGTLSGGQQQMVAIARAFLNQNRIIFIDEPTKGLAPLLVDAVAEAVKVIATESTVVLVEQNLAFVHEVAANAVVLAEGRIVHSSSMEVLRDNPQNLEALLGARSSNFVSMEEGT